MQEIVGITLTQALAIWAAIVSPTLVLCWKMRQWLAKQFAAIERNTEITAQIRSTQQNQDGRIRDVEDRVTVLEVRVGRS